MNKLIPITIVKSWMPEQNPFKVVIADITHKCNMECKNCYIPNRDIGDMDLDKLVDFVKRLPNRAKTDRGRTDYAR